MNSSLTFLDFQELAPGAQPEKPRPAVKRLLGADGANVIVFTFSPGQSLPDHRAAHPIIVTSALGELDFSTADQQVTLTPGKSVYLDKHVTHRVDLSPDADEIAILVLIMLTGTSEANSIS